MSPHDSLEAAALEPLLTGWLFTSERYHYYAALGSSNSEAARLARAAAPEGSVVVAGEQSQGRGRHGRSWLASRTDSLCFSMVLRPELPPRQTPQLTLVAAVALAEALLQVGVTGLTIKWPNDLLLHGRKVAGILTEMAVQGQRVAFVVVGVGINVHGVASDFPAELQSIVATVAEALPADGLPVTRPIVLSRFLAAFESWYGVFLTQGFAPVRSAWLAHSAHYGRQVQIQDGGEGFIGEALTLDEEGYLLVRRSEGQVVRVMAGDVAILPL